MHPQSDKSFPDWAPENAGDEFAVRVVKGVPQQSDDSSNALQKRKIEPSVEELIAGVLRRDRVLLAKAITIIESNAERHRKKASEILSALLTRKTNSLRIGISGVPGAGKSTLIESLGIFLLSLGLKVAVLAVDPTSSVTKGSIMGDKTRMEKLAKEENCFIRPSPSGGTLGGVTRKSRETILACEAAGFDVILVETVGVGQSEITVRSMVDFFALILIAGGGDELQGIKKGVIEIADSIIINKADNDNEIHAKIAAADYSNAVHYLRPATEGWTTRVLTCSAIQNNGIVEIWDMIKEFQKTTLESGCFENRRREQNLSWVFGMVEESLKEMFYNSTSVKDSIDVIERQVLSGVILPSAAAEMLLEVYRKG